jgi:hypothetical protein
MPSKIERILIKPPPIFGEAEIITPMIPRIIASKATTTPQIGLPVNVRKKLIIADMIATVATVPDF